MTIKLISIAAAAALALNLGTPAATAGSDLEAALAAGGWSGAGYYGITDDDRVCLSMAKDKGRLRCLTLLEQDGKIVKYRTDGSAGFEMLEFHDGKTF